jgi:hypothetical protein
MAPPDQSSSATNVARWLSFSERLLTAYREFRSVRLPGAGVDVSDVHLLGYALLARTTTNFCGVVTLVRAALLVEARTLARSCLENSFYIVGLLLDGDSFVGVMTEDDVLSQKIRGQIILERRDLKEQGGVVDTDEHKSVQDFLKLLRQSWPKPRRIHAKALATKGPLAGGYLLYNQLSADSAHPSLTSLGRYVDRQAGTPTLNFSVAPTNEELVDTLTWACLGSLSAFVTGSELLQAVKLNAKIAELAEEYHKLANSDRAH